MSRLQEDIVAASNRDVDRLMRSLAKFLLRNSAEGTFDLQSTMSRIASIYGTRTESMVTMEGLTLVSTHADGSQTTAVVHAQPSLERLDLVSNFKTFTQRVVDHELSAAHAADELDAMERSHTPFPWWLRLIGVMLFSVGFAPSMQADWHEVGCALILGAVMACVYLIGERMDALRTMIPLVASSAVAIVGFSVLDLAHAHGGPVLVMIPALFVMIPGDFLCAAAAEIAVGQFTVGTIRLVQSFFVLAQLAGGVIIGAAVTGVGTAALISSSTVNNIPVVITVLAWIPFSIGLGLTFCAHVRDFIWILLGVYVAWGVQLLFAWLFGPPAGTFVAAAVLTLMGALLSRSSRRPPSLVIILGGVFVLTVGSMALRGITTAAGGHLLESFRDMTDFVFIAGALSFGLIVGTSIAVAIDRRTDRALDRALIDER